MIGNFTTQPHPVIQAQGLDAVFKCQYNHPGGGTVIYAWLINEVYLEAATLTIRGTTTPSRSGDPIFLTITALHEHDHITIQCEADVRMPGARYGILLYSRIATLRVQGKCIHI